MNAQSKVEAAPLTGLDLLRADFPDHQISKLPKETGAQAKQRKADIDAGKWPPKCPVCEGFHHPRAVHLDYVGHAALTDRLLDCDPAWSWEPLAVDQIGLPAFDNNNGLWIKLTVCGVTRLGYGSADGKQGGDAKKEIIGDALRNAAMRFGAALDLWHKGDLHLEEQSEGGPGGDNSEVRKSSPTGTVNQAQPSSMPDAEYARLVQLVEATKTDTTAMLKHFGVKQLIHLNQAQYAEAVEKLTGTLAEMAKQETNQTAGLGEILDDEILY